MLGKGRFSFTSYISVSSTETLETGRQDLVEQSNPQKYFLKNHIVITTDVDAKIHNTDVLLTT